MNNIQPLISVVVPCYNSAAWIKETLESALNQTHKNLEIICVDNASTDNTVEVIKSINDDRIQLVRSDVNLGAGGARNIGINTAVGDYIATLDSDDLWHPTKLEKQLKVMEQHPYAGLVYCWSYHIDSEGEMLNNFDLSLVEGDVLKHIIYRCFITCGSVPLFRKSVFDKVGLYNYHLLEDRDMYIRTASQFAFKLVPEFLVSYRQRPTSVSKNLVEVIRAHELICFKAKRLYPEVNAEIFKLANSLFYWWMAVRYYQMGRAEQSITCAKASLTSGDDIFPRHQFRRIMAINYLRLFTGAKPKNKLEQKEVFQGWEIFNKRVEDRKNKENAILSYFNN